MKKWYAVEYAGYWVLQEDTHYGEPDLLNADDVGKEAAERNAKLAAAAPELLAMLNRGLDILLKQNKLTPGEITFYKEGRDLSNQFKKK